MVKLFADGADYDSIVELSKNEKVVGFTTNPTLMRQAGVENYEDFSKKVIKYLAENRPNTSLSLEVFADENDEMYESSKEN
jgi:transaldolase